MDGVRGKRLLILGANPETVHLVLAARRLGVEALVTDGDPKAPAKAFADIPFDVDGTDVATMESLCRQLEVDGVMVGVADRLVNSYRALCNALRVPCYVSAQAALVLTDKAWFKKACRDHDLDVVPEHRSMDEVRFPCLVKPVDSSGGKGVSVCHNLMDLSVARSSATFASPTGRIQVEPWMTCDDVLTYWTFSGGKAYLSAMGDRKPKLHPRWGVVNHGSTYPSKHLPLFMERTHDKMVKMFGSLGVRDGVLLVQAFVEDGRLLLFDPGFRLQGEAPHVLVRDACGFDHEEMLVRFALTGAMEDPAERNDPTFGGLHSSVVCVSLRAGRIDTVLGLKDVEADRNVVEVRTRRSEGDVVGEEDAKTERRVFSRIFLRCGTRKALADAETRVRSLLRVMDGDGKGMVLLCK